ncbi:MAG: ABC transporter ATP-binding protein, partial [Lentisphaerota bacterium]
IAVMYLGSVMEVGTADDVYHNPVHPYTQALLTAVPLPNPRLVRKRRFVLKGDVPSPMMKPSGCGFRTRCPIARPECADSVPQLIDLENGRQVACHFIDEARMMKETIF